MSVLWDRLRNSIEELWRSHDSINQKRCEILRALINAGEQEPGLFTLTAPTGSGKTLSSMAFALRHALLHNKRRIIYVIPYISILEQTQQKFESIFHAETVVAHYANVDYHDEDVYKRQREKLVCDNRGLYHHDQCLQLYHYYGP